MYGEEQIRNNLIKIYFIISAFYDKFLLINILNYKTVKFIFCNWGRITPRHFVKIILKLANC